MKWANKCVTVDFDKYKWWKLVKESDRKYQTGTGEWRKVVEFKWALSTTLHFSRNQKDENEQGPFAITKSSSLPTSMTPRDKYLVTFLPMNMDDFWCKIISIVYSHCGMVVNMVKESVCQDLSLFRLVIVCRMA